MSTYYELEIDCSNDAYHKGRLFHAELNGANMGRFSIFERIIASFIADVAIGCFYH